MSDPDSNLYIPHLLGIALDAQGVAKTLVVAHNRRTGERQTLPTTSGKVVIFDAANFTSGYLASDVIEFQNVGASSGLATITINSATGGFQEAAMDCVAASTVAVNL